MPIIIGAFLSKGFYDLKENLKNKEKDEKAFFRRD